MTSDRLVEIKARLEAATQGDWVFMDAKTFFYGEIRSEIFEHLATIEDANLGNDGELIANPPADLRDLITALKAAQGRIATLEAALLGMRQIVASVKEKYDGALEKYGSKAVDDIETAIEQGIK